MRTFDYLMSGFIVRSELELPGFPLTFGDPDVVIRRESLGPALRRTTPDAEFAFVPGAGKFLVRNGNEVSADVPGNADPALVKAVLLGRVMSFLLRQRGWLPLHASGVLVHNQAVLFMAPSGGGKSTTAAAFYRAGYRVLTDDVSAACVDNGHAYLRTIATAIKLFDDSAGLLEGLEVASEFQVDKHCFCVKQDELPSRVPLAAVYLLEFGQEVSTEILPPVVAVSGLSENTFFSRRGAELEVVRSHLHLCAAICSLVPVSRLVRPRSFDALPLVIEAVIRDVCDRSPQR